MSIYSVLVGGVLAQHDLESISRAPSEIIWSHIQLQLWQPLICRSSLGSTFQMLQGKKTAPKLDPSRQEKNMKNHDISDHGSGNMSMAARRNRWRSLCNGCYHGSSNRSMSWVSESNLKWGKPCKQLRWEAVPSRCPRCRRCPGLNSLWNSVWAT